MAKDSSDKIIDLDHPHKRMHLLLSILAFLIVIGSITFYQMQRTIVPDQNATTTTRGPDQITQAQKDAAIAAMKARLTTNPPISQSQKDKALLDLKKRMKQ